MPPRRRGVPSAVRAAASTAARRGRPRIRLENDERRAQLLALAKHTFSDRSYDEVSIDDFAHEAKISKGLLYHYFPTKRDLYVAGLREIAGELVAAITAVPQDVPPLERVRMGLDAYLAHIARHARAFVSLMRGGIGSDPEVAAVVEGVRLQLYERFIVGSPFEPLVAADPRFQVAIRGWLGFVEAASIDWCASPKLTHDELRELLALVLFQIVQVVVPSAPSPNGE